MQAKFPDKILASTPLQNNMFQIKAWTALNKNTNTFFKQVFKLTLHVDCSLSLSLSLSLSVLYFLLVFLSFYLFISSVFLSLCLTFSVFFFNSLFTILKCREHFEGSLHAIILRVYNYRFLKTHFKTLQQHDTHILTTPRKFLNWTFLREFERRDFVTNFMS